MGALGLMGVFAFAIGGTITFSMLFFVLTRSNEIQGDSVSVFGFLGFLLIGFRHLANSPRHENRIKQIIYYSHGLNRIESYRKNLKRI